MRLAKSQLEIGAFLKVGTPRTRSAAVDAGANESLLCQIALEDASAIKAQVPRVGYFLRARSAILIHHDGIFLRSIEIAGLHHPAVELDSFGCGELEEFFLPGHFFNFRLEVGIID